jgi:hypothetical protein
VPIVVVPSQGQKAPPTVATSPDGRLTATVDVEHAGVLLAYDGSGLSPQPTRVRFTRAGGAETVGVRSGDLAYAPGGYAYAYDAEVGLAAAVTYTATPLHPDGTSGTASSASALSANPPGPDGVTPIWLTSLTDPGESRPVLVTDFGEATSAGRVSSAQPLGSSHPVTVSESATAPSYSLTVVSQTAQEHDDLARLLCVPGHVPDGTPLPLLLVRYDPSFQRRDDYATLAKVAVSPTGKPFNPPRQFKLDLTTVARPDATGAPLRIPGRSYDDIARAYTTYSDIAQTVPSYNALLTGN